MALREKDMLRRSQTESAGNWGEVMAVGYGLKLHVQGSGDVMKSMLVIVLEVHIPAFGEQRCPYF